MKQIVILTILTLALLSNASAQTRLTDEQWLPLFTALESEDWDNAEKLSSKYLGELKEEAGDPTLPRLRYMYLYSAAGRIAAGKMSYDDFEKKIKDFVHKEIFLPARFVVKDCKSGPQFNALCKGDEYDIMVTSTNGAATNIHAFEYIKLKDKFDFAKNDGKVAAVIGTIDSIAPNPNKSKLLIMRIYVVDARVQIKEK